MVTPPALSKMPPTMILEPETATARTSPVIEPAGPTALHDVPFHVAIRSAPAMPPAPTNLPPTTSFPGRSVLSARTSLLRELVAAVAPVPT